MSAGLRKTILATLLLSVATVFAYDRLVVKRQPIRIQAELMDLVNDMSHTYNEDEILGLVGRPCDTIFESKQKKIVKFSWHGLTSNSYDLFVVFRKFRGSTLISDVSLTEPSAFKPFLVPESPARTERSDSKEAEVRDGEIPTPFNGNGAGRGFVEGG